MKRVGRGFVEISQLNTHKHTHARKETDKCETPLGTFSANDKPNANTVDKLNKCKIPFIGSDTLARNRLNQIHTLDKPYKCAVCGVRFAQRVQLKIHMQAHSGKAPIKCVICGEQFALNSTLKRHMRIHTGERPYACDVCGATFSQSYSRNRHKLIHDGKKSFRCDNCKHIFGTSRDLKMHVCSRNATVEKPAACDKTGIECSSPQKRHLPMETAAKPFRCDSCGAQSDNYGSFKWHVCRRPTKKSD